MIIQISSGQGPTECELAVSKLLTALQMEFLDIEVLSAHKSKTEGCYTSVLFSTHKDLSFLEGSIQWICKSPFRPNHKRKKLVCGCQYYSGKRRSGRSRWRITH